MNSDCARGQRESMAIQDCSEIPQSNLTSDACIRFITTGMYLAYKLHYFVISYFWNINYLRLINFNYNNNVELRRQFDSKYLVNTPILKTESKRSKKHNRNCSLINKLQSIILTLIFSFLFQL